MKKVWITIFLLFALGYSYCIPKGVWWGKYCSEENYFCISLLQRSEGLSLNEPIHISVYGGKYFSPMLSPLFNSLFDIFDADELVVDRRLNNEILVYANGVQKNIRSNADNQKVRFVHIVGDACAFSNKVKYQYSVNAQCFNNDFHP